MWGRLIRHNDKSWTQSGDAYSRLSDHTQHPTMGSPRTSGKTRNNPRWHKHTDRDRKYAFLQLHWALFRMLDFCSWGQCLRFQILLCSPELRCCPAKLLAPKTRDGVQSYLWPRTSVLAPPSFPNKEMFLKSFLSQKTWPSYQQRYNRWWQNKIKYVQGAVRIRTLRIIVCLLKLQFSIQKDTNTRKNVF